MNEEQAWEEVSRLVACFGLFIESILLLVVLYKLWHELRDELRRRRK